MDQVLPLDNSPNQTFKASLQVDGKTLSLQFALHYNEVAEYWTMTILDNAGSALLNAIPLLTGDAPSANILEQYAYLKIGSAYIVNAGTSTSENPTAQGLGTDWLLAWSDTPTA